MGERVLATNDITDKMAKNYQIYWFSQTHLNIFIILVKNSVFFLQNVIIHEDNVLEYTDKNGEMLTMADKGGRGGLDPPILG